MIDVRPTIRSVINAEVTLWPSLAVGLIVCGVSLTLGSTSSALERDVALASMATFLFGVLLAFTTARARERVQLLQDTLSKNNAALLYIHQTLVVFSVDDQRRIRNRGTGAAPPVTSRARIRPCTLWPHAKQTTRIDARYRATTRPDAARVHG